MPSADTLLASPTARRLAMWSALGAGALALSALAGFAQSHALMINVSPSLPYWAIWLNRGATPARGDIVLFDPPDSELLRNHFGRAPKPFGKRVVGVPGDVVRETNRTFFVNDRAVVTAKRKSLRGEPLALGPTGVIPAGCYFIATGHKDGFDSRYAAIGWICRPRILGVGRPVL